MKYSNKDDFYTIGAPKRISCVTCHQRNQEADMTAIICMDCKKDIWFSVLALMHFFLFEYPMGKWGKDQISIFKANRDTWTRVTYIHICLKLYSKIISPIPYIDFWFTKISCVLLFILIKYLLWYFRFPRNFSGIWWTDHVPDIELMATQNSFIWSQSVNDDLRWMQKYSTRTPTF